MTKFVAYLRVSTDRQGRSGLGLAAQRATVRAFVSDRRGTIIAPEFVEVETGKNNARPKLAQAIQRCELTGATLVVAKLDRLSRNAAFLMRLRDSGVPFVAADIPEANTLTIGIFAVVAQAEREAISIRTKAALAAAKARGTKLGNPRGRRNLIPGQGTAAASAKADLFTGKVRPIVEAYRAEGLSLRGVADRLNAESAKTARGSVWTATAVKRVLER